MAKRTHTTEVAVLDGDGLETLGAGRREGWLSDPTIFSSLHPHFLALANRSLAFLLPWGPTEDPDLFITITPSLAPFEGEITAVEWLSFGDLIALALGTSAGYLLVYSLRKDLIHKQVVHSGRVLRIRFREVEGDSDLGDVSQELCVVTPGVVARFDGSDIKNLLETWFRESETNGWESRRRSTGEGQESFFAPMPYRLWSVSKFGSCADAAITGLMPPPLLELQSEQRHYCAITVGNDAVISAFRISERRGRSIVGAIISKVVPAAFSTISSLSSLIWRSEKSSPKKPEAASQPFARSSPLTCLKDHPRKGERITISPSGTLAAVTDSLGRILLLDTRALVVVRLWKGYRDASCLFMEMLIGKDKGKHVATSYDHGYSRSQYCLCLAIHAPKKGIVEVWKMRTGPRLLTIACPNGSRILQPSSRMASPTNSSEYVPLEVFLLNGDSGQLSVLNKSIN